MTLVRSRPPSPPSARPPSAFTLIEVLIAVLILALGLLGIGAIFPAVIRAQREANDATLGTVALEAAKAYLSQNTRLNRLSAPGSSTTAAGWGELLRDTAWSPPAGTDAFGWEEPVEIDPITGSWILNTTGVATVEIPAIERVWPPASVPGSRPRFVWDIVARRLRANEPATGQPTAGELQIAMFLRRIDPKIRVPAGMTLYGVMTPGALLTTDGRLPVAVGADGRPSLDGLGGPVGGNGSPADRLYAAPILLDVRFSPTRRNRLQLGGGPLDALAEQVGQRLVDNLGNVYTVLGVDAQDDQLLVIDPPVPSWVVQSDELFQVALTPQVPAAVSVFNLRVNDPVEP